MLTYQPLETPMPDKQDIFGVMGGGQDPSSCMRILHMVPVIDVSLTTIQTF